MVECPTNSQQDSMNDILMYFKRFTRVLLAAHPSISILNWDNLTQNTVTKAVDISPNEDSIKQCFSGLVVQLNRHKIKGFVKIHALTPFSNIKCNDQLWTWLTKNRVFICTTQLAQMGHVNIRWMKFSHAEYSSQELARVNLHQQMGR